MKGNSLCPALGVFLILFGSYAFFWHSRDWNLSSRLMLTYALVDRGQVSINGLEDHTRDRAKIGDRYYSDKQPGYSLLAVPPYVVCRLVGLPPHPLGREGKGFAYWPADYWITLATSGVLTSLCGAILTVMAGWLGCGPRRATLIGLTYGLATPAYVYATLAYGHQATACLLLMSYGAIERSRTSPRPSSWTLLAGVCASAASVVELQVGPVSALMGLFVLWLAMTRRLPLVALLAFGLGAAGPAIGLILYNTVAFGSPLDMGYFHEDLAQFRNVHSTQNPLGLASINWGRSQELLINPHRGLLVYAPILLLAPAGFFVLAARNLWSVLIVSLGVCLAVFLVNLSYPEWTGGMSTGPRLLLPLIPFAMIPVAATLGSLSVRPGSSRGQSRLVAIATGLAVLLTLVGGVEMLMFQAVGGRIPPNPGRIGVKTVFQDPWRYFVWPLWRGDPVPLWREGVRFEPTLVSRFWPQLVANLPAAWKWLQFVPLVGFQLLAIGLLMRLCKKRPRGG